MPIDFSALESLALVEALRFSRWGYAAVNAAHILGICLLVGGALPMALRLFGVWPETSRADLMRVLSATAASGLVIAMASGALLFATRASEYADHPTFQLKLVFILIGTASAVTAHAGYGRTLEPAPRTMAIRIGALSALCWLAALTAGRLIAFIE